MDCTAAEKTVKQIAETETETTLFLPVKCIDVIPDLDPF